MRLHPEELSLARIYTRLTPFEGLTVEQLNAVKDRGQALRGWFQKYFYLHCFISSGVIILLLAADFIILLKLPSLFLGWSSDHPWRLILLSGLIIGSLRGWVMYSLVEYSLHEGAAHKMIFPPRGPISKRLHKVAINLSRLGGADPVDFARNHRSHHAYFGTERDGEFLNFVLPIRYWKAMIPFSMFFDFSDFITHRGLAYSQSRRLSGIVLACYNLAYLYLMARVWGPGFATFTIAIASSHVSFGFDRIRQFSEHNLMPIENQNGARSFGPGFWGMVVGGGPWGQPCHWMHHMVPNLPWYQQIMLHRYVVSLLTPCQRKQFLLQPILGYPKLLWRLWTEPYLFMRKVASSGVSARP